MPAKTVETKQHAHDLLDQLGPGQLAAIVSLLEVMIREEENLTEEDRRAVSASREYFRQNPQGGIAFEDVVGQCGFTMDQVRNAKDN